MYNIYTIVIVLVQGFLGFMLYLLYRTLDQAYIYSLICTDYSEYSIHRLFSLFLCASLSKVNKNNEILSLILKSDKTQILNSLKNVLSLSHKLIIKGYGLQRKQRGSHALIYTTSKLANTIWCITQINYTWDFFKLTNQ